MQPYNEQQQPYNVPAPSYTTQPPTYTGNKQDNTATLAMLAGVGLVATSCTFGVGSCLLPIFALTGGIIGLRGANQAINPNRTRTYAWIAIGAGGLTLLLILGVIVVYGGIIIAALRTAP